VYCSHILSSTPCWVPNSFSRLLRRVFLKYLWQRVDEVYDGMETGRGKLHHCCGTTGMHLANKKYGSWKLWETESAWTELGKACQISKITRSSFTLLNAEFSESHPVSSTPLWLNIQSTWSSPNLCTASLSFQTSIQYNSFSSLTWENILALRILSRPTNTLWSGMYLSVLCLLYSYVLVPKHFLWLLPDYGVHEVFWSRH